MLGAAVGAMFPLDSGWVFRLAPAGDYLLRAEADFLQGRASSARDAIDRVLRNRHSNAADVSIDAVLPEVHLLLALGDTAAARAELARALGSLRNSEPLAPFNAGNGAARMAAMLRAMGLYASIASDPAEARRWSAVPLAMWRKASPDDLPSVALLKKHAGT